MEPAVGGEGLQGGVVGGWWVEVFGKERWRGSKNSIQFPLNLRYGRDHVGRCSVLV